MQTFDPLRRKYALSIGAYENKRLCSIVRTLPVCCFLMHMYVMFFSANYVLLLIVGNETEEEFENSEDRSTVRVYCSTRSCIR